MSNVTQPKKSFGFLVLVFLLGIVVGAVGGVVGYGIAAISMPWLSDVQRGLIIPGFTAVGGIIGMYTVVLDLVRARQSQ
jgi:hypothetical protein